MAETTSASDEAPGAHAEREYGMALHLSDEALLDEERSPFDAAVDDQPVLFVQLLDRNLVPLSTVEVVVSGVGIPAPRSLRTEADGTLLIEDCGPGVYEFYYDGSKAHAHTLTQHDLDEDDSAYRVMLLPVATTQAGGSSGREDV